MTHKLYSMVYDADYPEHTGELTHVGGKYARVTATMGGGYWVVPLARICQGNGRGLSKRATVQKKIAASRKYQPMSERSRNELRAAMEKPAFAETPAHRLIVMLGRLLDDLDELHKQLKVRKQ